MRVDTSRLPRFVWDCTTTLVRLRRSNTRRQLRILPSIKEASREGCWAYAGSNFRDHGLPASSGRWIVVGFYAHLLSTLARRGGGCCGQ